MPLSLRKEGPVASEVREYAEGYPVEIANHTLLHRWIITAYIDGKYDSTAVDLFDVLRWVKANHPEWLKEIPE